MSLINCPECGHEISDKADFCPNCGCPQKEEPQSAVFMLRRETKALFLAVIYEVYIDNQLYGILKNGESITATLNCGNHRLSLVDKNNFNRVVYDNGFYLSKDGLVFTFSAAPNISMLPAPYVGAESQANDQANTLPTPANSMRYEPRVYIQEPSGKRCPRCGGTMTMQTVVESRKSGCGTILLYVFLTLTVFGLLIVIPLMLRRKTETVTYAVCQQCGFRKKV